MQIFHSPQHTLHNPAFYLADGKIRPCPDDPARIQSILDTLLKSPKPGVSDAVGQSASAPAKTSSTDFTLHEPTTDPLPALRATHTPDYLHYLQTIHKIWHAEFQTDVLPDTFIPASAPSHFRIQNSEFRIPTKPSAQAGYYCFDLAAPITAGTWQAALAAAACAVSAAQSLLTPTQSSVLSPHRSPSAYALTRPPGHHAGPNYCGGFCYLNNAAIAASHLLLHGRKKIAILDIDYHHGNGTQDIFYRRNDVLFVSLHADPNTQYPYFWGHADETGEGEGQGFTANFPLPRGVSESRWLATLDQALARTAAHNPEALIVSLGVDTAEGDAVGDFHLSEKAFATIGKKLAALQRPTAFIHEGGYTLNQIGRNTAALLTGFSSEFSL